MRSTKKRLLAGKIKNKVLEFTRLCFPKHLEKVLDIIVEIDWDLRSLRQGRASR
jgi:hypothetical protein